MTHTISSEVPIIQASLASKSNEKTSLMTSQQAQPNGNLQYDGVKLIRQVSDSVNHGVFSDALPKVGYCLVFIRELKHTELVIVNGKLIKRAKGSTATEERNPNDDDADAGGALPGMFNGVSNVVSNTGRRLGFLHEKEDLPLNKLRDFAHANLVYSMRYSEAPQQKYVYVFVTMAQHWALNYVDKHEIDVPIDAEEAVLVGRHDCEEFILADRTWIPADGPWHQKANSVFHENGHEFKRVKVAEWHDLHINYETLANPRIYRKPILNERLWLRVIQESLISDTKLGGANVRIEREILDGSKHLSQFFALQSEDTSLVDKYLGLNFQKDWKMILKPSGTKAMGKLIEDVRVYYGELYGYYFAFLSYYSMMLRFPAVVGVIFLIAQIASGKIDVYGAMGGVIVILIWSTVMIEYWYRKENILRFKWGMMEYEQSEMPRAVFRGKYAVSSATGHIIEEHSSPTWHWLKILFSLSTMFLSICVVIALVGGIWVLKDLYGSSTEKSIVIGILNSIQIQILNQLYTRLAVMLNNFENHRLQQDYYNHLVVKRIVFIVVNSFNSLFYMAFYDSGYGGVEERLRAIRTQLLTLFFTAIVIQNFVELILPTIYTRVTERIALYKEQKYERLLNDAEQQETSPNIRLTGDVNDDNETEAEMKNDDRVLKEVKYVMDCIPVPDLLSNTAEVVVLHGYIVLFIVVFPAMPLLALVNNYFEFRIDFYNLLVSQRPPPYAGAGIGVWKTVMSSFNMLAVFSNMGLLVFRTDLIKTYIGHNFVYLVIWYFVSCLVIVFAMLVIRAFIVDVPTTVQEGLKRQKQIEKHLVTFIMKGKVSKEKQKQDSQARLFAGGASVNNNSNDGMIYIPDDDDEEQKDKQKGI